MNNLKMTKEILTEIYDDNSFKAEVSDYLNTLIDEELAKEIPDCDFIDECIEVLENVESGDYSTVIPFIKRNNLANGRNRRRVLSILVACAILIAASLGAVAVNYTIEKKKEEAEKTTSTTSATTTTTRTTTTVSTTENTTTTTSEAYITGLNLSFDKSFKDEYAVGEKFDSSGINITAVYSDGKTKAISENSCQIIVSDKFGKSEGYETITVKYDGVAESFKVRIIRTMETKVLNSIYASFPEDFDFTAEDIENADLSSMEVYAVYSDKTEEKLQPESYKTEIEIVDRKTAIYTITYEGCYASFGIRERRR